MALLSSDMIREIRHVADTYSRHELDRRAKAAADIAARRQAAPPVQNHRD